MTVALTDARLDRPDRALTDRERLQVELHLPVLRLWSRYLVDMQPCRTLGEALTHGAPVLCRPHRRGTNPATRLPYLAPVLVRPDLVERSLWHLLSTRGLPEGLDRMPGPGALSEALEFMGVEYDSVRHASTQRPVGEPQTWRTPYRRQGWMQMSGEVWQRLSMGRYVPVRTALRGRPARRSALIAHRAAPRPLPSRARLRALTKDREVAVRVLRDYLRTAEPTCLMSTALAQDRPLAVRRRGRPAEVPVVIPIRPDVVLVSASALAVHARAATNRLELPMISAWWTRDSASVLLNALADEESIPVTTAPRFSPMDVGRPTKYTGWYRVSLSWADAPELDAVELTAQWKAYETGVEEAAAAARAAAAAAEAEFDREFRLGDGGVEETRA